MNRKLEEYKKKANKINRTIIALGISIFLLGLVISIVIYSIKQREANIENQETTGESLEYYISLENNMLIFQNSIDIDIGIEHFVDNSNYKIIIKLGNDNIIEKTDIKKDNRFNIKLEDEGEKKINIIICKNEKEDFNTSWDIYYIKPYEKQFLDETEKNGVSNKATKDMKNTIDLIKSLGIQYVRHGIWWGYIEKNNTFDFDLYDDYIGKLKNNNIKSYAILGGTLNILNGEKLIINNENLNKYKEYVKAVIERYNHINTFEVLNEPNKIYKTENEVDWYSKILKETYNLVKKKNVNNDVVGGATMITTGKDDKLSSEDFLTKIMNKYNKMDKYSFHPYDSSIYSKNNNIFINLLNKNTKFDKNGGFVKSYISEYGLTTYSNKIEESKKAERIVEQTILERKYNIEYKLIYCLRDTGTDSSNSEHNFGLVTYDYTPKLSYYAMKNYYQNTNGSEYIGTVNLQDGLETHVYNKDGKPLIITWSQNTEKTYSQPLGTMTAKDLYGKEIVADVNGNIEVTTSPVYLYNVSKSYYYQAISNMAVEKYTEFEEKFAEQISKVEGLKNSVTNLKQRMQNIATLSTLDEATAIDLMKQHYNLGNTIIQAYKSGTLQIEDVKLSSMLDSLNDVGNSYEDLVTVSATTRNANINETSAKIKEVDTLINNNQDIEIVYPSKILEFSKDFYEKASYINGLEEENDIKTGLIVSKNLHSILLADWAKSFANIYVEKNIDKYIAEHPVTVKYSKTEPTNQSVTASLVSNVDFTVTNNSNSKDYTFTQNGTFTFKYEMKGRQFEVTATVNNIDKDLPTITGVQNDNLYMVAIAPIVSDANLKEVRLYKNSNLVQNYVVNSAISEDGNYNLVATDLAGNEQKVQFYISKEPVKLNYSTSEITNQDVIVTLQSDFEFKVNNNSNSKNYTFKDNGTFEFDITIKQLPLKLKATVNNIDKIAPTIQGLEEGKTYIGEVTPKINDANLEKVELRLNGQVVQNYTTNSKITDEGLYKIIAKDKAGNSTTVSFQVLKNKEKGYKIQNNTVKNITNNTKMSDFKNKLNMKEQYDIYRNGQKLQENSIIATGDVLKTKTGNSYTLIVVGDINKDGNVNIQDIVKMRKYLLERNNLDQIEMQAADTNLDGSQINIQDLVRMRIIALNKNV